MAKSTSKTELLFRRTYKITHLAIHDNLENARAFIAKHGNVTVDFRPDTNIAVDGSVPNACWADVAVRGRANAAIVAVLNEIRHNRAPVGPEIVDMVVAAKTGVPYHQQSSVMLESLPPHARDFIRSVQERIDGAVTQVVGLIRWRCALYGPPDSIIEKGPLEWSDGREWTLMPFVLRSNLATTLTLAGDQLRHDDVQSMWDANLHEPTYRELFREAVELQESSPRSALILTVAAAEIGIKATLAELAPDSEFNLLNVEPGTAVSMYREQLPRLAVKRDFGGVVLPPPDRLLDDLEKAVQARNLLVHRGAKPLTRESLIEKMNTVRDLLLMLDYYRGYQWAAEQLMQLTRDEIAIARRSRDQASW